jgi:phosphoribosylformylglycinamidine synthase
MGSIAVVCFPGSNCEHDVVAALARIGAEARVVWHHETDLGDATGVVLPGGFAHGDYLRTGAIARFSPVMAAVRALAEANGPVLGICNGFQVLTEARLLPGALRKNVGMRFICRDVICTVDSPNSVISDGLAPGTRLNLPINHYEGNYTCDEATLADLLANDQVILRYVDNPNGSVSSIAGIANRAGNVVGLMPHPERASDALLGSTDGLGLLEGFARAAARPRLSLRSAS